MCGGCCDIGTLQSVLSPPTTDPLFFYDRFGLSDGRGVDPRFTDSTITDELRALVGSDKFRKELAGGMGGNIAAERIFEGTQSGRHSATSAADFASQVDFLRRRGLGGGGTYSWRLSPSLERRFAMPSMPPSWTLDDDKPCDCPDTD